MPATKAAVYGSNILLSDGVGTTVAPGSYFGFGQSGSSAASTGPRIQAGTGNPNGVVTSPMGSQWTDTNTATIYVNTDGATAWATLGGGTTTTGDWFPLIQQSPLNAKTDYFPGTTLDPKWGTWNPGANTTVSVSATQRLRLLQTTHVGDAIGGIYQTVPAATRYAITARVQMQGYENNIIHGGIFAGGNVAGAPTTASIVSLTTLFNSGVRPMQCSFLNWTDYQTLAGALLEVQEGMSITMLRLFVDTVGAAYTMLLSPDGYSWIKFITVAFGSTALGAAPTHMGLCVDNANSTADASLYAAMFRIDATTDPFLACGGFA